MSRKAKYLMPSKEKTLQTLRACKYDRRVAATQLRISSRTVDMWLHAWGLAKSGEFANQKPGPSKGYRRGKDKAKAKKPVPAVSRPSGEQQTAEAALFGTRIGAARTSFSQPENVQREALPPRDSGGRAAQDQANTVSASVLLREQAKHGSSVGRGNNHVVARNDLPRSRTRGVVRGAAKQKRVGKVCADRSKQK